jgi:hypothetical protein
VERIFTPVLKAASYRPVGGVLFAFLVAARRPFGPSLFLTMNECTDRPERVARVLLAKALSLAVLVLGSAGVARAQFTEAPAGPREVPAGQTVNLFAQWGGGTSVDGFYAELPRGWRLEGATALQSGGARRAPLTVRPAEGEDVYFIGAERTLRGSVELVLRVRIGERAGRATWALVPFTYRAEERLRRLRARRLERRATVEEKATTEGNRVFSFQKAAAPLLLGRTRLPALSTRAPFTVETWFKTTGLGEVVLSTWDGAAQRPYPLELVIGPGGRLRYYRGRPSRHESMVTPQPVADGAWHHAAVTHDPEAGRTRLLLDGVAVDSLRGTVPLEPNREVVALGGRVPPLRPREEDTTAQQMGGFTGTLDEVHFWPQARRPEAVRRTMRQPRPTAAQQETAEAPLGADEPGAALLHFEGEDWPPAFVTGELPPGTERVRSGLRFYAPITELRARTSANTSDDQQNSSSEASARGAVSLSWQAPGRGAFVIERSTDGEDFREIGRREAQEGRRRYTFTDAEASAEVVFYRIRQQFAGGAERTSGTLKVGRGTSPDAPKQGVTLVGNFPNPFSEETTIAYQVREETRVRLSVWSLTGQRVATLLDKRQSTGHKKVTFRPQNLSSGTYFVRLRAGGKTRTHKMALVK